MRDRIAENLFTRVEEESQVQEIQRNDLIDLTEELHHGALGRIVAL